MTILLLSIFERVWGPLICPIYFFFYFEKIDKCEINICWMAQILKWSIEEGKLRKRPKCGLFWRTSGREQTTQQIYFSSYCSISFKCTFDMAQIVKINFCLLIPKLVRARTALLSGIHSACKLHKRTPLPLGSKFHYPEDPNSTTLKI